MSPRARAAKTSATRSAMLRRVWSLDDVAAQAAAVHVTDAALLAIAERLEETAQAIRQQLAAPPDGAR